MQKLLTLFVFSIFVFTANAQFQKGNKVLGAGLNFQTNETEYKPSNTKSVTNNLGLNLEIGFAKNANKLNGFFINAGYGQTKYGNTSQSTSNSTSLGAGYFSKIYKPLGKSFFVFGEGRAGINYYKQKISDIPLSNSQQYGMSITVYPGLAYKWNDRILLELRFGDFAAVNYNFQKTTFSNGDKNTSNGFSLTSNLGLGYLSNIGIGARWIIK